MQKLLHEGVEVETSVDGFTAVDFPEVTAEKQERRHPVHTVVITHFELARMIERVKPPLCESAENRADKVRAWKISVRPRPWF